MRHNRIDLALRPVAEYLIAPDHYHDPRQHEKWPYFDTYSEFRKFSIPYKAGDVVYIHYGNGYRKAYIEACFIERARDCFLREKYRVHVATAKGDRFCKNWYYTWAGFIERGYEKHRHFTGTISK